MKTIYISNLPSSASEESVRELFSDYGVVRAVSVSRDIFSNKCRGFGNISMEGHEARAAMAALDGHMIEGKSLRLKFDAPKSGRRRR